MSSEEILYTMALTRMTGFGASTALLLYRRLGSAKAVYDHRGDIGDVVPDCSPRLVAALSDWGEALKRSSHELAFVTEKQITPLTLNDADYPARLRECPDAPLILYYRGTANLNQRYVVSMVGTRHSTPYGHDLIARFVGDLRQLCPEVLIVSGLAYGVDICSHRQALQQGFETVGVLAHGLDQIYPPRHRDTAAAMTRQGGLLTEYMTQTQPKPGNFVSRNRIVAGLADATVLVESAAKGGGLITCSIARSYDREVFAFPGAVGAPYSEGCNKAIRNNTAALVTSAQDFVEAMGWQPQPVQAQGVERQLFPELTPDEQRIVSLLRQTNDLQLNIISVKTNLAIGSLTALLFQLEMKGVVRPLAGGTYHLLQ